MAARDLRLVAADLRLLVLDVDGVMTDGGIILVGEKEEAKRFDVQDGLGVRLAQAAGLKVGIISSRESAAVSRRAQELNVDAVHQGVGDNQKERALESLLERFGVSAQQMAYVGDDLTDMLAMARVGAPIAVENARPEVKRLAVYVTKASGGHGAVREAVEWLLELRGQKEAIIGRFAGTE